MPVWKDQEENLIKENISRSTKEIYLAYCDTYGSIRSYNSIQKKVKQIREAILTVYPPVPVQEPVCQPPNNNDNEELGDIFSELLGQSYPAPLVIPGASAIEKKENENIAKAWLKDLIRYGDELDITTPHKGAITVGTSLCVLISDVHVGKFTNTYNLDIARERIIDIPNQLFLREGNKDISEIVIMLAGDLVEGEDIYPTQSAHIQCSSIEQVQECVEALWEMILRFQKIFNCRISIESVPGNHGRVSKTANEKTNWDNIVYYILSTMVSLSASRDIHYPVNYHPFKMFNVQDKVGMIYHHGVKHTGTPAMREKIAGWSAVRKFDFMGHGHWHEWHVGAWLGKPVIANGCVCGPDDLAERMAREDSAKQAYFRIKAGEPLFGFGWLEWK